MLLYSGVLKKMQFSNQGTESLIKPNYFIQSTDLKLNVNGLVGKTIRIDYSGKIFCTSCGKNTKKSYGQGYCYPCFISVPQTEECVLRPELCRAHEGIARDMDFAKENCLTDQYVYLALSGGLKVGVTRYHQVPTRWIDQGATKAVKLLIAKNRFTAGQIEVALKKILADKTNWRKMLKGNDEDLPLLEEKHKALDYLNQQGFDYTNTEDTEFRVEYPVASFPDKVVSKDLVKEPILTGKLMGIKGQYLLLDMGAVINIRKHTGFSVNINVED